MRRLDQEGLELLAPPRVAADGERAERVAVIGLAPADDVRALRLALLDEVLARELERRLDRLRAARDEVDLVEGLGRAGDERVGERLHRLVAEERGVREGQLFELALDRSDDRRVGVAKARYRGTARGVEVALAFLVEQVRAFAAHRHRVLQPRVAVENVGHRALILRPRWRAG